MGKYLARVDEVIGDPEAKKYFCHTDHVGSIRVITDQAGQVVYNADYLAFGTRFGKDNDFEELHGFTGKEYDPDIGLYYFNARWYDPDLGRFISEDPARDPKNPNLYSYCGNNPVMRVDPTGEFWWLIGAILGGLDAYLCGGDFMQGFAMGAITGALGGAVGGALGNTAWGAALAETSKVGFGAVSGAIGGGITGELFGEGFGKGAVFGAVSGAISGKIADSKVGDFAKKNWFNNALVDGLKGGFNALARGGDFVEGFTSGFGGFLRDKLTDAASDTIYEYFYHERIRWEIEGYHEVYYSHEEDTIYWVDSKGQIIESWKCRDAFAKGYDKESGLPRASLPDGDRILRAYEPGNDYGISYGTFYIDTGDPRGRDIHGGGLGLSTEKTRVDDFNDKAGAYAPYHRWVSTLGCLRMQNADGEALSRLIIGQGNAVTCHVCTTIEITDGWIMGYYQEGIGITRFTSNF